MLDEKLWPLEVKSISDWTDEYMPECEGCALMQPCCEFFSSAHIKQSTHTRHPESLSSRYLSQLVSDTNLADIAIVCMCSPLLM